MFLLSAVCPTLFDLCHTFFPYYVSKYQTFLKSAHGRCSGCAGTCTGLRLDVLICPAFWRHLRVIRDKKLHCGVTHASAVTDDAGGHSAEEKKQSVRRVRPSAHVSGVKSRRNNSFLGISISKGKKRTSV